MEYGLLEEDIKEIILDLSYHNYEGGPEEDHNKQYSGMVWIFKYNLDGTIIYIKFRYDPPENLICISFHEDE